jgi:uncharacterized membrane protein YeiB
MADQVDRLKTALSNQREPGFGPVRLSERIEILDVLRGWALFGVFLCNMRWFSWYED